MCRVILPCMLSFFLLVGALCPTFGAETNDVEQVIQLTNHSGASRDPTVHGNLVAYIDNRSGNWNVILYDIGTGRETPITRSPDTAENCHMDGETLVYTVNGGDRVRAFDLATMEEHTVSDPYLATGPAVSGDQVVWLQKTSVNDTSWDLVSCILAPGGPTEPLSLASDIEDFTGNPSIDGDILVWDDGRRVYHRDLSGGATVCLTSGGSVKVNPAVDGGRIVWQDHKSGNWDIFMKDLSTDEETRLTSDSSDQTDPDIYGDTVTWTDERDGNKEIYMLDLSVGEMTRVTDNNANQRCPVVQGEHLIWMDMRNGNWDIYLHDLDPDSDGDGVDDSEDVWPGDPAVSTDSDGDGHPDRWNPGMTSENSTTTPPLRLDSHPMDPAASLDTDDDGSPNEWNPGMDAGDSTSVPPLWLDQFPGDPAASKDSDGDGAPDEWNEGRDGNDSTTFPRLRLDVWPEDPAAWQDSDGDGHPDEWAQGMTAADSTSDPPLVLDSFPEDPAAAVDGDDDGHPDRWNPNMTAADSTTLPPLELDLFPDDPDDWKDTDGDGVGDNADAFPLDVAASVDGDRDGHPDEWNEGMDRMDSTTGLRLDEYPENSKKWRDKPESPSLGMVGMVCAMLIAGLMVRRRP